MGGSKNPSVSPSPLRKEQADSSDPQNWQQPAGSNSSGSLLGGDGDLVDGSQYDGGDASVINIGEPGTGLCTFYEIKQKNNSHQVCPDQPAPALGVGWQPGREPT